ncbi:copper resistance protein CopC [Aeromicrobium marinum DSM 15272]|uniref:Copper resistance protein CopC n=1 Tax=Aeromicrobium marinum DSM 15272 TaxID=585531 RepID=E2S9Q1_9ACTN|nr:copper resistance CopC family protein [Aeromicrobium marinum]EFQ83975.1 copper resistance protein CopC [Aeromicrobium marinum DSM 15272]
MPDQRQPVRARAAWVLLVLGLVAPLALTTLPAEAHAGLVSSDPADGSSLTEAPDEVTVSFNENVARPAFLALTAPDGTAVDLGEPRIVDATVTADVPDLPLRGSYALSYRVVSADGHPVEGTVTFELLTGAEPAAGAAAPVSEESYLHRHRGHIAWGAGAAAVAVGLIAWPLVRRREDAR